ncbi:MAG: SGNH/GDSL hydrolase family protein [Alphaproteobacteria bacterium]|nr:SGNH/GDSL hydrolase family protein [Alphaproteobacteria bacterium]
MRTVLEPAKDIIKVAVIGDSLALTRPTEGLPVENIYPTKLAMHQNIVVFNRGKSNADTDYFVEAEQLYHSIRNLECDYYVIHLGICDCSPRIFSKTEKIVLQLVASLPYIGKLSRAWIGVKSRARMYHTKRRRIQNVTAKNYRTNLLKILETIRESKKVRKVILLNIAAAGPHLTERSYGVAELISQYNDVLATVALENKDIVTVVDVHTYSKSAPERVLPDGHHVDHVTHDYIYKAVYDIICKTEAGL